MVKFLFLCILFVFRILGCESTWIAQVNCLRPFSDESEAKRNQNGFFSTSVQKECNIHADVPSQESCAPDLLGVSRPTRIEKSKVCLASFHKPFPCGNSPFPFSFRRCQKASCFLALRRRLLCLLVFGLYGCCVRPIFVDDDFDLVRRWFLNLEANDLAFQNREQPAQSI